ncbi:hypothetical protein JOC86_003188 [Bacillus pakistanensis]|uniref:Uncharacterized protein n=1 Tax=Rossellomorea pakistanensis TaxID=992288 RepID=A0ABS2NFK1_9BACI|nr:hypothetical protein [Bacillus pakistanensis]MBM7586636.1 hypothetical protein [Bacillus pakistanensis]
MRKFNHMEAMFLPTDQGMIKIFIYGFQSIGSWGQVIAQLDDVTVNTKGYSRRKTIVRSLTQLHQMLVKKNDL